MPACEQYGNTLVIDSSIKARLEHVNLGSTSQESAVEDILHALGQISGSAFQEATEVCPDFGIFLVHRNTLLGPSPYTAPHRVLCELDALAGKKQAYLLHATHAQVWIISDGWRGLCHGAYGFLEVLGIEYLLPTEAWTVIPNRPDLRIHHHQIHQPALNTASWQAQFGSQVFGFNDPALQNFQADSWYRWRRRKRFPVGYATVTPYPIVVRPDGQPFPGHALGEFVDFNRATLKNDALNFAVIGGIRSNPETSYNLHYTYHGAPGGIENDHDYTSYAGIIEAFGDFIAPQLAFYEARKNDLEADPDVIVLVGAEPTDGQLTCQDTKCGNLLRKGPYGFPPDAPDSSLSDRVFHFAVQALAHLRAIHPSARISLFAYNDHATPPNIPVDGLVVSAVLKIFSDGVLPDVRIAEWLNKNVILGVYDYFGIAADQGLNDPRLDLDGYLKTFDLWLSSRLDHVLAESTTSLGAVGLHWFIYSKKIWNSPLSSLDLIEYFWKTAFSDEALRTVVRRASDRWGGVGIPITSGDRGYLEGPYDFGEMFADLRKAGQLAESFDSATQERVAMWQAYAWFLKLLYDYRRISASNPTQIQFEQTVGALFEHVFYTFFTVATQAIAMFATMSPDGRLSADFANKWDPTQTKVHGQTWEERTGIHPPEAGELIARMQQRMDEGTSAYPRIPISVPYRAATEFDLVPYADPPDSDTIVFDNYLRVGDETPYQQANYAFFSKGKHSVVFEAYSNTVNGNIRYTVFKPDGTKLIFVDVTTGATSEHPVTRTFDLSVLGRGLFRILAESVTSTVFHRVGYPNSLPFVRIGIYFRTMNSFGTDPLYFDVPSFTESFLYHGEDESGADQIPQFFVGNSPRPGTRINNPDGSSTRTWLIQVAPEDRGRVWNATIIHGRVQLIGPPNIFSRREDQMLTLLELSDDLLFHVSFDCHGRDENRSIGHLFKE